MTVTLNPSFDIACACCDSGLAQLDVASDEWRFFRCRHCGYWTARTVEGKWPTAHYDDTPTFDYKPEDNWSQIVRQGMTILARKFDLSNKAAGVFLDVGSSEGVYLEAARQLGWYSVGVEIDQPKVLRSREKGLHVVSRFEDVSVRADFILMRHVIEHVAEVGGFIRQAAKLLNENGNLCIEVPNQSSVTSLLSRRRLRGGRFLGELYPPTHIHAFEKRALAALGRKCELQTTRIVTYSRADRTWFLPSQRRGSALRRIAQRSFAGLGHGGNIAAFYSRQVNSPEFRRAER